MEELKLTSDQRLRLELLDRFLPTAGATAIDLAQQAYAFVIGAGQHVTLPTPDPEATRPALALVQDPVEDEAAEEAHHHIAADMTLLGAIAAGHNTRRAILEATGIPAGSWHRRIRVALESGVVTEDRSALPYVYALADASAGGAPSEPEVVEEPVPAPEPVERPTPEVPETVPAAPAPEKPLPAEAATGMAAVIAYLEDEGHEVLPQLEGGFLIDGTHYPAVGVVGKANRLRRSRHEPIIEVTTEELREYVA